MESPYNEIAVHCVDEGIAASSVPKWFIARQCAMLPAQLALVHTRNMLELCHRSMGTAQDLGFLQLGQGRVEWSYHWTKFLQA